MNDCREGEFYCLCNKVKKIYSLCKMSRKGEGRLERFQHNHDELKKLADKMWPYFEEIFILDSSSLEFFNKKYDYWSSRNRYNCSYSYLTLQEIIDNNEYVRKPNSDDRYFRFTYGYSFFLFLE